MNRLAVLITGFASLGFLTVSSPAMANQISLGSETNQANIQQCNSQERTLNNKTLIAQNQSTPGSDNYTGYYYQETCKECGGWGSNKHKFQLRYRGKTDDGSFVDIAIDKTLTADPAQTEPTGLTFEPCGNPATGKSSNIVVDPRDNSDLPIYPKKCD